MRAFSAAGVGFPVSHCSVGSFTFSWSMAMAGPATAAPKTTAAAVERKALRDCSADSACKAVDTLGLETDGAKAAETAMMERTVRIESFMFPSEVW